jgi:PAS domain S-box-containing protein
MPFKNLVFIEDVPKVEKQVERRIEGKVEFAQHTFRGLKKNGEIFYVESYGSTNLYQGRPVATGTLLDVTERKQAEEALKNSEKRYREFFAQSRDCVFITSKEGKWIDFNSTALEMFGYDSREELSQVPVSDLYVNPAERGALTAMIEKHGYVKEYPVQLKRKDGVFIDALITLGCQKEADNPGIKYYGTIRDITKHKQAEDALRASERRLMDMIDFLPDPTIAIDLEGKVIAWNRAMEKMTGIKAKDMLGKGDYEYSIPFYGTRNQLLVDLVLKPNKNIEKRYSLLQRENELLIVEGFVPSLRGSKVYLWGKASPLYDGKGNIIGAIESIRDITERKNDEENLRKREKDLELKKMNFRNSTLR